MVKIISKAKFLLLFGAISFFVFISSCSDDEETPKSDLIGFWTVTDVNIDATIFGSSIPDFFIDELGFSEIDANIVATLIESQLNAMFIGSTIDFRENKTYFSNFGGEVDDGTWSSNANSITLDPGTVDEQVATIISLSATTAIIGLSMTEYEDIDDNPLTPDVPIDLEVELTLTK